jgi:hypothetical protein
MGEAAQRLAKVAGSLQACKVDSLAGEGRVVVVFDNSGQSQSASLAPGSPFEGTKTADCVLQRFREIRVPPFDGPTFTVNKRFRIP